MGWRSRQRRRSGVFHTYIGLVVCFLFPSLYAVCVYTSNIHILSLRSAIERRRFGRSNRGGQPLVWPWLYFWRWAWGSISTVLHRLFSDHTRPVQSSVVISKDETRKLLSYQCSSLLIACLYQNIKRQARTSIHCMCRWMLG